MLFSKYCYFITNTIRIGEKIVNKKMNYLLFFNELKIKQLEITFRIPSNNKYEHGFITMLMLTEKLTNNKPVFLLDKNTLSKNKTIKIGLILTLKNESVHYYLKLCCLHSIPKFYSYGIFFNISKKTYNFAYIISKILSNSLFSYDKDVSSYYDYLGDLPYEFDFLFRTSFKHVIVNKLLAASTGIHFINQFISNMFIQMEEIDQMILLEDDSETDIESDVEYSIYSDMNTSSDDDIEYSNEDNKDNNTVLNPLNICIENTNIDNIINNFFEKLLNNEFNIQINDVEQSEFITSVSYLFSKYDIVNM